MTHALIGLMACLHLQAQPAQTCHPSFSRLRQEAAEQPMPQRDLAILKGLGGPMECLPAALRLAAQEAAKTPQRNTRAELLYAAAKPFLPAGAAPSSAPGTSSRTLAEACPFQGNLIHFESVYDCIDEGTYAFAWSVQAKLMEQGAYQSEEEMLLMDLLLSVVKNACP